MKTVEVPAPHSGIRIPELLAPAGDWECAKAAVENGADAIYFGLERFNARMRAHNFTAADLPKLMEFLHRRGVRGYVTFNTLVFTNELADAEEYLRSIISAGVDAAIVQDVGVARLIRKLSPDFPIHASTQMTVTSAAGVEFAKELGCNLVVLARECSIAEIEKIRGDSVQSSVSSVQSGNLDTDALKTEHSLPIEVFVHGALCVAYSGQCLTSESLGGRSANRGECAQACRMPYELISDGKTVPLGDKRYLLSPQDLAGLEVLPGLVGSGVSSLKIEGRLKTPEYVANITRVYRQALEELRFANDDLRADKTAISTPADTASRQSSIANRKYNLEMGFSRGLYTGWFRGINNQELAHARFGKKRGVYLGEVRRVQNESIYINLEAPLKPGDGVVFDAGHPDQKEEGGRVYEVKPVADSASTRNFQRDAGSTLTGQTILRFGYGDLDFSRIKVGDKIWKTDDPELNKRLRQTFAGDKPQFHRPVSLEVHGLLGKPLTLIVRDEQGNVVQVASEMPLEKAEKQPLTTERLRDQLGRLGGTPFKLGEFNNQLEGEVILPMSELNRMRRDAVEQLDALRAQPKRWTLTEAGPEVSTTVQRNSAPQVEPGSSNLIVLVRNLTQLDAALLCGVETIYCEFEDPKKYREAVTTFHTARGCSQPSHSSSKPGIFVAPPRIFKMGEEWILNQVRSSNADGYLVRNYDHLSFFADCRRVGDFSLNVANPLTAEYFKNKFDLERVTASYDLNNTQLDALLKAAPPEWFEITIHQHMPMFHMEHCVFCAFLSKGTDYKNCGRPCDKHEVKLRDRVGMEHPLKADVGCRNTVFNARAQTGAEFVSELMALGVRNFRIEFVNETPEEVTRTITQYRQLLRGEITGAQLWRDLKLINQLGVTRGQMEK
ncbi:MAG: U32 family peptidase [Verrucomicrobia bacterium]|nr:U32 family peptidase [Verrucomicrobiota bacterium]